VSLESGGNTLVHPSVNVATEKVVLNCDPPSTRAEGGLNRAVNATNATDHLSEFTSIP
jgi:hypothetical protein